MEFLILIVVLLGFMLFMSSRQRKQQKAQMAFRNELAPGQEVMTASGLFGTVVGIDEENDRVTLDSAGSRSVWLRAAISKRIDASAVDLSAAEDSGIAHEAGTIAPANTDVPDDISGLDTAQREYREQRHEDDERK